MGHDGDGVPRSGGPARPVGAPLQRRETWYTRQASNQPGKYASRRLLRRRGAADMESLRGPGGDLDHDEQGTARLMAEGNERVRRYDAAKDNEEGDAVRAVMWGVVLAAPPRAQATSP